jgi:hypothetical protein
MEQKSNVANKLKNKKKDVILADNLTETSIKKPEEIKTNQTTSTNISENKQINKENPLLRDSEKIKFTEKEMEIDTSTTKNKENIDNSTKDNESNNHKKDEKSLDAKKSSSDANLINHMIFNIQVFFSQNKKICPKIYDLLLNYLSVDHLKVILEERDCMEICGNILCNKQISKPKAKKYFYNSKTKEFVKEDVLSFFCNIRCFQKFKDAIKIANNFDYLRLFKFETLFILYNSKNYYSGEIFLKKIAYLIKPIYENLLKNIDDIKMDILKTKYDNYFNYNNEEAIEKINNGDINSTENVVELNKVFEEKLNINK